MPVATVASIFGDAKRAATKGKKEDVPQQAAPAQPAIQEVTMGAPATPQPQPQVPPAAPAPQPQPQVPPAAPAPQPQPQPQVPPAVPAPQPQPQVPPVPDQQTSAVPPPAQAAPQAFVPPSTTAAPQPVIPPQTTAAPPPVIPPQTTAAPQPVTPPQTTAIPQPTVQVAAAPQPPVYTQPIPQPPAIIPQGLPVIPSQQTQMPVAYQGDSCQEISFGDSVSRFPIEKYHGQEAHPDRIAIPLLRVLVTRTHFLKGVNRRIYCFGGKCCEDNGISELRYAIPAIQYTVDKELRVISRDLELVYLWLNQKKYDGLRYAHNNMPLTSVDLMAVCEDENWQRINYTIIGPAVWCVDPVWAQEIVDQLASAWHHAPAVVGERWTEETYHAQIREALVKAQQMDKRVAAQGAGAAQFNLQGMMK